MTLSELKVGKMYVTPQNSRTRIVWNQEQKIVDQLSPNIPFVLLQHSLDQSSSKILTSKGIVGWIKWELNVYLNTNAFQEAKLE